MTENQIDSMRMLELAYRLPIAFWSHFDKIDTEQENPPKWNFLINKTGVQCSIFWEDRSKDSTNKQKLSESLGITNSNPVANGNGGEETAALLELLLGKIDDESAAGQRQLLEALVGLTNPNSEDEKPAQVKNFTSEIG